MKGLRKSISILAIAGLLSTFGAAAAHAEVANEQVDVAKNIEKGQQDIGSTANTSTTKTNASIKDVKTIVGSSINKAHYLKSPSGDSLSVQPSLIAQKSDDAALREDLKIRPLEGDATKPNPVYNPGLTFAGPSAFGANWGDAFVGIAGATPGKLRNGEVDGSINAGFGLGNALDAVGLELNYNLGSIRKFASNGSFDAKLHRIVYAQGSDRVAVAVGWNTFAQYGNEGVVDSSLYGAVTSYSLLQPDNEINKMPISFTAGVGGGIYRSGSASTGVFAGVGVQVAPQLSIGGGWSGVGINAGLSYVPVPSIPLTIGLIGGDLTDNSRGGRILVLNISYGFNFLPQ
jgi:hypothetical protein